MDLTAGVEFPTSQCLISDLRHFESHMAVFSPETQQSILISQQKSRLEQSGGLRVLEVDLMQTNGLCVEASLSTHQPCC